MRALIQRVLQASVQIGGQNKAQIGPGLLVFLGISGQDRTEDGVWLSKKIAGLRIFGDAEGKMNLSVKEVEGDILLISQFTLYANTLKGNRPSFVAAAPPAQAFPLYEEFIHQLEQELGKSVYTGEFGADMQVQLLNNGPVTIG
ncbi:MAG: D-tyrosyl-tRNA(Tyr) deacylase [Microscillaceae bacterium]|nr:D-tyrosyl-tRNA(Tyr) deacylase [Microscillaceae bacterium]